MKRRYIFEFEDQPCFPDFLRVCMTRYIAFIHKLFNSSSKIEEHLGNLLKETGNNKIIDLCSGSGGPMLDVFQNLREHEELSSLELTMSDLYPNKSHAKKINSLGDKQLSYSLEPVDATNPSEAIEGVRTMISSFHHMPTQMAKKILQSACDAGQPIFIYELSDNSHPQIANWITLPIGVFMVLLFTPFVRPITFTQMAFTYLFPILPLVIAWDAAVSNVRTFTESDLDELTSDLEVSTYSWQKVAINGRGGRSLVLIGKPVFEGG